MKKRKTFLISKLALLLMYQSNGSVSDNFEIRSISFRCLGHSDTELSLIMLCHSRYSGIFKILEVLDQKAPTNCPEVLEV